MHKKQFLFVFGIFFFSLLFNAHANASGGGEEVNPHSVVFVEMDPLVLPVVEGARVVQSVTIVVSLDVPNKSAAELARALKPKLADAFITILYEMLNDNSGNDAAGVVQTGEIKKRLHEKAAEILGDKNVNGVLLQVVQQRAI